MKLSQFRSKLAWFILGLSLVTVLGAYVTTVMFDATYFTATDTSVSLKGSLTNFAKLTTNAFQEAGSYQPAAGTLTNVSTNTFVGTGRIVLESDVTSLQTNANPYISEPVYAMTGDQTLTYTNSRQLLIWNSTTNCTVTFADGATNGWNVSLKALGAGNLILTNTAGKTFDGFTSVTQSGDIILHWAADGTNYRSGRSSPKTFVGGNTVYASPADGSTNPAVMRALVTKDLAAGIVADTNLANPKLSLTGGTVSGPVLTTSSSSNAPSATELATGGWVRSLLQNGSVLYTSTNVATVGWDTNAFYYQSTIPVPGGRSYTPAAGDYFGSSITTNTYLQVNGPITVSTYFTSTGGAGNSAYTVHPEIYFTYALTNTSLTIGDYVAQSQTLVHGAVTNRYDFVIAFPPYISTNSTGFYIVRRWKVDTKTGTDTLTLSLGTNTPSQIGFTVPAAVGANWVASGTSDSTLSGVATVGGLVNNGTTVHTPSAIQSLSTNSTIAVNASTLRVTGNGAAVTLTNLPSIATNSIADGTIITVRGTSDANTVTLQDYRTLTGTCLAMEVATVTLKNGSEMRFQWSAGNQRWQAMAFSANSSQNHPFNLVSASDYSMSSVFRSRWDAGGPLSTPVVATRAKLYESTIHITDGSHSNSISRLKFLTIYPCSNIRLVFGQGVTYGYIYQQFGYEGGAYSNNVAIKAAVENATTATMVPATFTGSLIGTLAPNGILISDPIGINLSKGDTFIVRTYGEVAATNQVWCLDKYATSANGEGTAYDVADTNMVYGGTVTASNGDCLGPIEVIGDTGLDVPNVGILGDSIGWGSGDTTGIGFLVRAMGGVSGTNIGAINLSVSGRSAQTYNGDAKWFYANLYRFFGSSRYVICQLGINDILAGTATNTIVSYLQNVWTTFASQGRKVYQTTITPSTTSSDGWTTLVNQSVKANEANRVWINNWIKTTPAPLSGYFDAAATVEVSGKWNVSPTLTGDGTHPNATACALMSASISTNLFQ